MTVHAGRGFTQGVVAGVAFATVAALAAGALLAAPGHFTDGLVTWVGRNLGTAAVAFAAVLAAWVRTLARLHGALAAGGPAERVVHLDALAETWVGLFFGVGVIWTAIGMRSALLEAIGNGSPAGSGATMLARLVDGGILLSLTTTIVGGIGGYFMRVLRSLWLGPALRRFYQAEATRDVRAVRDALASIESRLATLAARRDPP